MIKPVIEQYVLIKERISEQQKILKEMRKEESIIVAEIKTYLNETGEEGLRIDDRTVVAISSHDKKICLSKEKFKEKVKTLLYSRGIDDDAFVAELLDKTEDLVQQQKLKIIKA